MAEDNAEFVITRYRDAKQNLRTTFEKTVQRAGMVPWPKLFQNMRSSRETELVETYPVHVVTAWLGNTTSVAAKHYLQTTEEHFEKAVQNPVQQGAAMLRNAPQRAPDPKKKPSKTLRTNVFEGLELPVGTRTHSENTGEMPRSESAGAQAGAIETENDSQRQLKAKALEELQRAWKAIRRMETLSDDRANGKAAERALSFVDKAFAELERATK